MPAYQALTLPPALYKGDSYKVWSAEAPVSGAASERIAVGPSPDGAPPYLSVEITFSVTPTVAMEIDIQESDTDVDSDFIGSLGGAIVSLGTTRVDLNNPVTAQFLRLKMVTAPTYNGGLITAKITRQ